MRASFTDLSRRRTIGTSDGPVHGASALFNIFALGFLYLILVDSVINYFVFELAGQRLPVALAAAVVVVALVVRGGTASLFSGLQGVGILLLVVAVTIGASVGSDVDLEHLRQMPLALAVFMAGYLTVTHLDPGGRLFAIFLLAVATHILLAAAIQVGLLPRAGTSLYVVDGMLVERLSLYMDPNYTGYYLLLAPSLFFVRRRILFLGAFVGCAMAIMVLVIMHTRSGTLILALMTVGALALRTVIACRDRVGRQSVPGTVVFLVVLAALAWAVALVALDYVASDVDILAKRFLASEGDDNIDHRLMAYTYMVNLFGRSGTIVPVGMSEFLFDTNNVLHAAIPAMFVLTGSIGVIAWGLLILCPLMRACVALLHIRSIDAPLLLVTVALLGMVTLSLTLPSPFQKQLWLMAGLTAGLLAPKGIQLRSQRGSSMLERPRRQLLSRRLRQAVR